jgi:two-component system NtrC family sensor kinase
MSSELERVVRSMSVRLFAWLFLSMLIFFLLYAYDANRATSNTWRAVLQQSAQRTSEMIKRATHYGMLLNQKEDVHHTIRRIARGPGVVGIRIYDKRGAIIFSSDGREIGQRVDLRAEGCVGCHDAAAPLRVVPAPSRVRIYRGEGGEQILGLINPIENEPACSSAACHAHSPQTTILGVLDVRLSMAFADEAFAQAKRRTLLGTLLLAVLLAGVSGVFIFRMVRAPVRRLIGATHRVAAGDLEQRLEAKGHDEISELAVAFNLMIDDLKKARGEVAEKSVELSRAQRQIVHMEKMASLGKLAATVAHELNNPIAGILNYSKLVSRELRDGPLAEEARAEVARYLEMIQKESGRCGEIVRNLLLFTRRAETRFAVHRLGEIVERALMVIRHRLEGTRVELAVEPLAGDDQIVCDADKVQQALVALLVNAVEAMPDGGKLRVASARDGEAFRVEVQDSGVGIQPEIMQRIFEPFFSTKENATGVGLGLSVAYGIVQQHGGAIEADSAPGKGTTFRVTLPAKPSL